MNITLGTNNSCIIFVRIYEALSTEGNNSFQLKLNIKSLEKTVNLH